MRVSALVTLFHEGRVLMEDTMEAISADPPGPRGLPGAPGVRVSTLVTLFHEVRVLMEGTMEAISADPRAREVCLRHRA